MAAILAFGRYLPDRILNNAELAEMLNCDAAGIVDSCGIEERRIAAPDETVADLAERASRHCLEKAGMDAGQIGLVILSSGTSERRFPGPASQLAQQLGLAGVPAIDLSLASAGGLFGLALAAQLAPAYGLVLVAAAEKMSAAGLADPLDRNVAILFGDGAGACLVSTFPLSSTPGGLQIVDSALHSDGAYARDLRLEFTGPVQMSGRSVIMQASRRIPAAINQILGRNGVAQSDVRVFLLHQANRNLTERIAKAMGVPSDRFFSNIRRYGNTSSASLLIAASEWMEQDPPKTGDWACLAAFGAGFHWGAALIRQT